MNRRRFVVVGMALGAILGACAPDDEGAALETANEAAPADMDDPAVWVHGSAREKSLIVAAAKKGGLRVYNLGGALVKSYPGQNHRFNNVDVQYDFDMGTSRVDLAVASDRQTDQLRIWTIDPASPEGPLVDVTDPSIARLFPTRPDPANREESTVENPNDGEHTAYGLALYRDKASDALYALVSQNNEAVITMVRLVPTGDGHVGMQPVRSWQFPYSYEGQDLTQENEEDPSKDFSPQFEGMVVDQQTHTLYAGQEDVGIWRVNLASGVAEPRPFVETTAFDPKSKIARDVEGLTIYYAADGEGYLLASSQGQAHGEPPTAPQPGLDDTFAVFERAHGNAYRGSFSIPPNAKLGIDGVQECDGADVSNVALPGFPFGVFITQDGYNDDDFSGAVDATNLKFTPWERVAADFPGGPLRIDTGYDPRTQR